MIHFLQADAARLPLASQSVDLVFGSPPYCDARTYGAAMHRNVREWVAWMLDVTAEACRVSRGLVIWVCAGVTRKWNYWPGPEGLLWEWHKRGGQAWRPAYWRRVGIPGGGGKQWLRSDVEHVLCFKGAPGSAPWADNTACGHPPKWAPGGEMSYRMTDGTRRDQWGGNQGTCGQRRPNGKRQTKGRPSKTITSRRCTRGKQGGDTVQADKYIPPVLANPGNLVNIKVGGNLMGHKLCHENEAPFPESLAEFFILGWCPPGGIVLDPFSGSGTTASVTAKHGRNAVGLDLRMSQCELGRRRCQDLMQELF